MDISKEKCRYCGEQAKYFQFATFICEKDECAERAMEDRGGPAGHIKEKMEREAQKKQGCR
ncbi:MAG TPA: hypothetical protein PLI21_00185 [Methanomassiliicoccaceae archaeon]|nr:hypothetical protein [Euryarchaeota archaeon]HOB37751.1 hypothetical protein [Methanomassiliicoccaceae archaeon]HOK27426.1 hypothetical protein [Methanomassiliicoccaceae archaeon]HOL06825.1 hypothetical protein [Methanomassiliicoccaceae archaeon]HOQ25401.1 hypothetical protein [Methanomassiliicoccaceae archaeon]